LEFVATPTARQLPEAVPTDVISLDAAYAIVSEMRGVYKNALEASSATNRGLKAAAQVGLACSCSAVYVDPTLVILWCFDISDIYSVSPLAEFGDK
jgi:hypothetical protein